MDLPIFNERVSIVTVTYNSSAVIEKLLASAPAKTTLIVVDNKSTDDSVSIANQFQARIVELAENKGFGSACNAGAKLADTEFLFFVNPDATLKAGSVEALVKRFDVSPEVHAANPAIFNSDGTPYFKRGSVLLPRDQWHPRGQPDASCSVNILTGAALFCRRDAFNKVGGFDENIFLYHEDDDLALRLAASGGKLWFEKSSEVKHVSGTGSSRSPKIAAIKSFHMARSRVYALRKHHRPLPFIGSFLHGLGKLVSPLNLVSARKRSQAIHFMRGIFSPIQGSSRKS